jgi:hypothetical protein
MVMARGRKKKCGLAGQRALRARPGARAVRATARRSQQKYFGASRHEITGKHSNVGKFLFYQVNYGKLVEMNIFSLT